jgi:hypothetical protein
VGQGDEPRFGLVGFVRGAEVCVALDGIKVVVCSNVVLGIYFAVRGVAILSLRGKHAYFVLSSKT